MEAIFSAQDVFAGMGPATANEIFYLAGASAADIIWSYHETHARTGLSPFLTEYEVFSCPSRVARLCEAFWTFAHNARTQLPYVEYLGCASDSSRYSSRSLLLNACYHGCVLAATKEQRLRFYESFHVYGKQQTTMSVRMHELRNRYIVSNTLHPVAIAEPLRQERLRNRAGRSHIAFLRNAVGGFFDVFEPSYLQPAFNKPGPSPNLAHLVFGPMEWCINGGRLPEPRDPLYVLFYNTLGKFHISVYSTRNGTMTLQEQICNQTTPLISSCLCTESGLACRRKSSPKYKYPANYTRAQYHSGASHPAYSLTTARHCFSSAPSAYRSQTYHITAL